MSVGSITYELCQLSYHAGALNVLEKSISCFTKYNMVDTHIFYHMSVLCSSSNNICNTRLDIIADDDVERIDKVSKVVNQINVFRLHYYALSDACNENIETSNDDEVFKRVELCKEAHNIYMDVIEC
jgi:hypothetical protein